MKSKAQRQKKLDCGYLHDISGKCALCRKQPEKSESMEEEVEEMFEAIYEVYDIDYPNKKAWVDFHTDKLRRLCSSKLKNCSCKPCGCNELGEIYCEKHYGI